MKKANAMVMALVGGLLLGCGGGETCGWGRCFDSDTCISVLGPDRLAYNEGIDWLDFPTSAEDEWWCARSCSKCPSGVCLSDPGDPDREVCSTETAQLEVYALSDQACNQLLSYEVNGAICYPESSCAAGTVQANSTAVLDIVMTLAEGEAPVMDEVSFGPYLTEVVRYHFGFGACSRQGAVSGTPRAEIAGAGTREGRQ